MSIVLSHVLLLRAVPQTAPHPDAEQTKILALENAWSQAEEH
jgi:hypothetical protein